MLTLLIYLTLILVSVQAEKAQEQEDPMIQELIKLSSSIHNKLDKGAEKITEALRNMTLTMKDSKPGDICLMFRLSDGACVVEFKIARLSTTIPMMMNFLPMVHSCPSLVKSFLPVLFNPCFCPSLTVHPSCPGMVQDMTKALISLC
ncbi:uncharacterized protein LOC123510625 [Portunus trituberculatus]|uniref:uncharacterized protein LOC123510625 n=1 Tax=Portunus trituberculatus TaxID=210409 RepID=UPI001E1CD967|nr:uncharacterized protein LOC123510625 [Portunus trituberculatus]